MEIRDFDKKHASGTRCVFYSSVHENALDHYNDNQLNAWAPREYDIEAWNRKIEKLRPFLAFIDGSLLGYADLQSDGYIDHFYVKGGFSRLGIGSALMSRIIDDANERRIYRLYSEVSLSARKFFESKGFRVIEKQRIESLGVELENLIMEKEMRRMSP